MSSPATGVLDSMLQSTIHEKARENSKEKPPAAAEKTKESKAYETRGDKSKSSAAEKTSHRSKERTEARTGGASAAGAKPFTGTEPKSNEWAEINKKLDNLTSAMNAMAPVVNELKRAHDVAFDGDEESTSKTNDSECESRMSPIAKKAQSYETKTAEGGLVDSLVQEVTEEEQTDPALPDKVVAVLKSIYEGGLSEQAAPKRKEKIKRPENCSFMKVTKVNPEIWDIAQRHTHSTDAKLQKMQETLIKGLIPLARLAGSSEFPFCMNRLSFHAERHLKWTHLVHVHSSQWYLFPGILQCEGPRAP